MAALLSLIGVTHRYSRGVREVTVLHDISLDLKEGDYACVLASKDEGKTTLLEVAAGIRTPNEGRVMFQGRDLATMSKGARTRLLRSEIGCVWNRSVPVVIGESVLAHVGLPLRSARVERKERRRRAAAMIERVGAADYADAKVLDLSQSQRMRVALAQACVRSPRLLIADELTDTLDLIERTKLLGLLQDFARDGMCVLMTAPDGHGAKGCNRLLSLSDGRLKEAEVRPPTPIESADADVVPFRTRTGGE
ncbi:MAG TPA: ATP-binding cassette domain-containing protein [Conexibacter sp.]|nr:ATP-binding cassette domain-containing protein [Conexibacter sp.]